MRTVRPQRPQAGAVMSVVCGALALGLALGATPALADSPSGSGASTPSVSGSTGDTVATVEQQADRALAVATRVLDGDPGPQDPEPTIALRDLRLSMPALDPGERAQAADLLARPTDGANDPGVDGYTAPAYAKCSTHFCVHYVRRTADKPAAGQVDQTLAQLNRVWKLEIGKLHYRAPLSDGQRGGNGKLDVYLKDVGDKGYYGYCTTEKKPRHYHYTYSGYCVFDNDFTNAAFGGADPLDSLRVTAAHEFFHAVQFAYDADEDPWLMESTATWMEEQVADSVDDNQQYLPYGQLGDSSVPLDTFTTGSKSPKYGNWIWWEYLSERYGVSIVRSVWTRAGSFKGAADDYSTQALRRVLTPKGGFGPTFARYAAANTAPSSFYEEGAAWKPATPTPPTTTVGAHVTVSKSTSPIDHMASRSVAFRPGSGLTSGWELDVRVDGPASGSPYAVATVNSNDGSARRTLIPLDGDGDGRVAVPFVSPTVSSVTLTLVNASTLFKCVRGTTYSCQGTPLRDALAYSYTVTSTDS